MVIVEPDVQSLTQHIQVNVMSLQYSRFDLSLLMGSSCCLNSELHRTCKKVTESCASSAKSCTTSYLALRCQSLWPL